MGSEHHAIELRSLTKHFGAQVAVDDLSFSVTTGSVTGFAGANGAGKTTTMRMALGLVEPSAGTALVNGVPYGELDHPRHQVGAALDGPGAHPAHSAFRHLSIIATAAQIPKGRVDEVLGLVELDEHASKKVGAFSLGMRQRLALAGALLGDPPILILDEPANGLDPPGILWMRALLRNLAAEGRAILVSSHLLGELAEVADEVVIIDRGRLIVSSPLADLLAGRQTAVELRCANPAAMTTALRDRGIQVSVDGDLLVIKGASVEAIGELAAATEAGPVFRLHERVGTFEDAYFEMAGSLTSLAKTTKTGAES